MIDFTSLFEHEEAQLAILSTYDFEPTFFETRLLRSKALRNARRVLVFVDSNQLQRRLTEGTPPRYMNERYLIVPVRPSRGVFHPKLSLLLSETAATLLCGSGNLTQAGAGYNIELINCLRVSVVDEHTPVKNLRVLRQSLEFFQCCGSLSQHLGGGLAVEWLVDIATEFPWIDRAKESTRDEIELLHTLSGGLLDRIAKRVGSDAPLCVEILSPFYDDDAELFKRIGRRWPRCRFEITAQQETSNLPVAALTKFSRQLKLFEITGSRSRRLHGKFITFSSPTRSVCIAGSANFTVAALAGHNVEACLSWSAEKPILPGLFGGAISRRKVTLTAFQPSTEAPPEYVKEPSRPLQLNGALIETDGSVTLAISIKCRDNLHDLSAVFHRAGEAKALGSVRLSISQARNGSAACRTELIREAGAIMCFLLANVGAIELRSNPVWIIRKDRLTKEQIDPDTGSKTAELLTTGRGLVEYIDQLAAHATERELINFLENLRIKFNDQAERSWRGGVPRVHLRDPFRSDLVPDWLKANRIQAGTLGKAICDFADRHEHRVLRRHARGGNINGMANFIDVLVALTRLLFVYYKRRVLVRPQVVGRLVKYFEIFTSGFESDLDTCPGYLAAVHDALAATPALLKKYLKEANVAGHLRALLLVAQMVRVDPESSQCRTARQCLPSKADDLERIFKQGMMAAPAEAAVAEALERHEMLTGDELQQWLMQLH